VITCVSWRLATLGLLIGATPLPAQNLKETQRAIQERILTEAGTETLIYSRVDFNGCAVTIQARTPRGPRGEEQRMVHLFHASSLDPKVASPGADGIVRLSAASGQSSIRLVTRVLDSVVMEKVSMKRELALAFAQQKAAQAVARAFSRLVELCLKDDRFKTASK
jgi:hypothetical protein